MKKILIPLMLVLTACAGTNIGQQPRVSDQKLGYGTAGTVEVKPGDTVYSIARRHNVTMSAVIQANSLKAPYVLQPGQTIQLPQGSGDMNTATTSQLPYDRSVGAQDMGGSVAAASLAPLDDAPISVQPLDGAPPVVDSNASRGVGRSDMVLTPMGPITTPAPGEEVISTTSPTNIAPADQAAAAKPVAPAKPGLFSWPLEGPVVSDFASTNTGIAITAPKGTAVQSAAGGTVLQAGSGDLGNSVTIRHPDGYVSVYGHLDRVLVEKDTIVGNGDVIGTVGQTGGVKSPQLHFEIRQGSTPVDPASYLPAKR